MKTMLIVLLFAATAFAQYRQLAGSSGSVAGKANSATHQSTALVGQPDVGEATGGMFSTRGGVLSIYGETTLSLDVTRESVVVPVEFSFSQNFPNPFNPSTTFEFALPKVSRASLIVYDELGREAARVFDSDFGAGSYSVNFAAPATWASGLYFAVFKTAEYRQVRKIVLLK